MSYNYTLVNGEEWQNRARYNIYRIMRRQRMAASNLTKKDGISGKTIFTFLSGRTTIQLRKLEALAAILDVPLTAFFEEIPDNPDQLPMAYHWHEDEDDPNPAHKRVQHQMPGRRLM